MDGSGGDVNEVLSTNKSVQLQSAAGRHGESGGWGGGRRSYFRIRGALALLLIEPLRHVHLRAYVRVIGLPDALGADVEQRLRGGERGRVQHEDIHHDAVGVELLPQRVDGRGIADVADLTGDLPPEITACFGGELLRRRGHDICATGEDDHSCWRRFDEALPDPVPDPGIAARDHDRLAGLGELGTRGADGGIGSPVDLVCESCVFAKHVV